MVFADLGDGQFLWTVFWWALAALMVWMVWLAFVLWRTARHRGGGTA